MDKKVVNVYVEVKLSLSCDLTFPVVFFSSPRRQWHHWGHTGWRWMVRISPHHWLQSDWVQWLTHSHTGVNLILPAKSSFKRRECCQCLSPCPPLWCLYFISFNLTILSVTCSIPSLNFSFPSLQSPQSSLTDITMLHALRKVDFSMTTSGIAGDRPSVSTGRTSTRLGVCVCV